MNREQAKFELMARAPACPDWFTPNMDAFPLPENLLDEKSRPTVDAWKWERIRARERVLQWPSYYAEEILRRGQWPTES